METGSGGMGRQMILIPHPPAPLLPREKGEKENIQMVKGGVEKVLFNHKAHKEGTKGTKLKPCNSDLCDLCVEPLCPQWLMDFDLFNRPVG